MRDRCWPGRYGEEGRGTIAEIARRSNVNVTVGAPITVEGRLWGVIPASWEGHTVPPVDAEERLARFAELLARDLNDGAQQRLVQTILSLRLAQNAVAEDREQAEALLAEALDHAEQGNAELRELAHGILPSVLTRGGLLAGVEAEALTNVVKRSRASGS